MAHAFNTLTPIDNPLVNTFKRFIIICLRYFFTLQAHRYFVLFMTGTAKQLATVSIKSSKPGLIVGRG